MKCYGITLYHEIHSIFNSYLNGSEDSAKENMIYSGA